MRILTLTTLYPSAAAPTHGIFVENRLRAFVERTGAEATVVAPAPWFPVAANWAGKYAAYARTPTSEIRHGLSVRHPRYAIPPKIGMTYAAAALERCFLRAARRLQREGRDFDVIDAHYLYPDGVAAVRAARRLGKPVVITARGTDVSLLPQFPRQRTMILEAVRGADAVVTVAGALKDELVRLGAPSEKIRVLRNGVNLKQFRPGDRTAARAAMDLQGDVVASVGHLIERKGHHLVIEALAKLPDATLIIAGDGEARSSLEALAKRLGVAKRVRFLGRVPHEALADIYNAADVLALASSREGWPNVLLEAMACGAPAVASPVWGSVEVIRAPEAGRLAAARTAEAIADSLGALLAAPPSRESTRRYAEQFSWDETSDGLGRVFDGVLRAARARAAMRTNPIKITPAAARPRLIVTVDTEEIFDWTRFDNPEYRIAKPGDIDRFQKIAAASGVKPLYFLTFPIISDPAATAYFRALYKSGAADLGLHLHQWVTPPADGFGGEYYSYQANLPAEAHRKKLQTLAGAFERAFGFRARAHRAGRYGVDLRAYEALAAVGVDLDFSPSAGFDFSARGGPDFSAMSNAPFAVETPQSARIAVTPVCGAWMLRGAGIALPAHKAAPGLVGAPRKFPRRLAAPMRLSCEGARFSDLAAATRRLVADKTQVLTFSLHSTTMTPGANQYARDEQAVADALETCNQYFAFFKNEAGGEFASLDALAAAYGL